MFLHSSDGQKILYVMCKKTNEHITSSFANTAVAAATLACTGCTSKIVLTPSSLVRMSQQFTQL